MAHYLAFAHDLTVRDKRPARSRVLKQLKIMKKEAKVMRNKEKTKLSDYDLDNLAKKLVWDGFDAQPEDSGLLHIVDRHFSAGREYLKTTENIRKESAEIMDNAIAIKDRKIPFWIKIARTEAPLAHYQQGD